MWTTIVKLVGLALAGACFGIADPDHAHPLFVWIGSIGVAVIFFTNYFAGLIQPRAIVHVLIGIGLLFAIFGLFNVGTWWGWIGLLLLFFVVEYDGEQV